MEPRHFIRRAIAVIIDIILLSQLAFYLVAPFANGDSVRLSGGIYQSVSCRTVPLQAESRAYFAERGVNAESASLCNAFQNGFYAGANLLVSSDTNAEGNIAENATTISVALNRAGQEVSPVFPVAFAQPILVFLFMVLISFLWRGQSIGKKITQIQIATDEGEYPSFMQVLRRETLKFAPAIVLFIVGIIAPTYSLEQAVPLLQRGENIPMVLGFLGISTFIYILWWVAPLLWWNGAMPYDRLNKTIVERYY